MRRLTVTGFTDDGTELLLTAEPPRSGPEAREGTYVLALDDQLWAALRHDRARLSQLQLADPAALRPRDVQSRVRGGQSPEEVAQSAGVPVARVIAYALPVMAEREHIARTAQATTLRHRSGPPVTLGEAVRAGVRAGVRAAAPAGPAGNDPELVWDAYRRAPGGWIVEVTTPGGPARFAFDPAARSVVPDDDAARDLVAEPEPPVIGVSYDVRITRVEAAIGVDAVPATEPDVDDTEPTIPVTSTPAPGSLREVAGRDGNHRDPARGRRSLRYLAFRDGEQVDAAEGAGSAGSGPVGQRGGTAPAPDADTPELGALFETAPDPRGPVAAPGEDGGARTARAARRPAVPSWDEIMFGRKDE